MRALLAPLALLAAIGCSRPGREISHEPLPASAQAIAPDEAPAPVAPGDPAPGAARLDLPPASSASAPDSPPGKNPSRVASPSGRLSAEVRDGELWVVEAGSERKLVDKGPLKVENPRANLPWLDEQTPYDLGFSPDERRVYFLRDGWATSRALFYAEVATGKVYFFHDANGYEIILRCKDKAQIGRVITFEHSYFDIFPGSAADLFFVVDAAQPRPLESRTGQSGRIGPVGFEEHNVQRFLARTCGVGQAPAVPPEEPLPEVMKKPIFRCGEDTFAREVVPMLDGTVFVRYRLASGPPKSYAHPDDIASLCKGR